MIVDSPVGQRISISPLIWKSELTDTAGFGKECFWFDSGTSALAAALAQAMVGRNSGAEVLLPAYTCPAVVAAARFVDAQPVLVDLAPDRPWMDLEALRSKINSRTAAVIAVNFLGINERVKEIEQVLVGTGAQLIYDCCQATPFDPSHIEYADAVAYSFGRGKPASVLHGGAAIFKETPTDLNLHRSFGSAGSRFGVIAKMAAYNLALNRYVYSGLRLIPALKIGITEYQPLQEIGYIREHEFRLLPLAIKRYIDGTDIEYKSIRSRILSASSKGEIIDLAKDCSCEAPQLLRFPVLAENLEHREELFDDFQTKGMGTSRLYEACLPDIISIEGIRRSDDFPNAKNFGDRLVTLRVPIK